MQDHLTRRELLQTGALAAAGGVLGLRADRARAAEPKTFAEYRRHDAVGLAELVRKGEADPAELLEVAIARADSVGPKINAIVASHYELAREAVRSGLPAGPFRGVPFLLKDLGVALEGTITTDGSRLFAAARYDFDSTLVRRYKRAGLVIFGKTHSPEFGGSPSSESALFGQTHNPWKLDLSAGGSSGGAAAAVAAGIVPAAHASDGGGSIRIPASACGLFGMKPTRGRVPMGPTVYETRDGLATAHAVSRSVRDSAALLDAVQGPALGDAYAAPTRERPYVEELKHAPGRLRIAVMTESHLKVPIAPECVEAVEGAARLCESLGHTAEPATPTLDVRALYAALGISSNVLVAEKVADREAVLRRPARRNELESITWHGMEAGAQITGVAHSRARKALHHASRELAAFMERYDAILSPTMAFVPPKLGVLSLSQPYEQFVPPATAASAFTSLYNMTGQPAMSVPLHWTSEGVPVGVMFAGRFGDEAGLFRLAAQLEEAAGWLDKLPPV